MMILAEELIAGLHDPKGAERGNYMVNALPKRKCPPPLPTLRGTEAWGLHAKMGFSAGRIVWWFTSSIIFLVAFATVWLATVDKTDVQTALTPGTVIITALTFILGIFQTLNQ
ncbi:uncharacterized protein BKA55DRAFT_581160 [Fusarium redolens]|uniref:Uncharacterized protein n=1 Tax=Fusarium redolens TaxID=48865 RepID=A0A9P9G408_FUSRE|nr:uncharacterized protein BKA55DRAFT_581160 [Fusarium redolens]KAH7231617.1 hypothetical protein BKA55DRAFT_581160 [Fusarium redolens]